MRRLYVLHSLSYECTNEGTRPKGCHLFRVYNYIYISYKQASIYVMNCREYTIILNIVDPLISLIR